MAGPMAESPHLHQWATTGAATRQTVLFLHGLGAYTGAHAAEFAATLCGLGDYHVIAPDMPGFGGTPALPAERYAPAALSVWLIDHVLGADMDAGPMHVVGHSWGAAVGCHLTAHHPAVVRTLALLEGGEQDWGPIDEDEALRSARAFDLSSRFTTEAEYLAGVRSRLRRWSADIEAAYLRAVRPLDGRIALRQRPETFAAVRVAAAHHPVTAAWPALAGTPLLLAVGSDNEDHEEMPAGMRQGATASREFVVLDHCGHFAIDDAGAAFAYILHEWWEKLEQSILDIQEE